MLIQTEQVTSFAVGDRRGHNADSELRTMPGPFGSRRRSGLRSHAFRDQGPSHLRPSGRCSMPCNRTFPGNHRPAYEGAHAAADENPDSRVIGSSLSTRVQPSAGTNTSRYSSRHKVTTRAVMLQPIKHARNHQHLQAAVRPAKP